MRESLKVSKDQESSHERCSHCKGWVYILDKDMLDCLQVHQFIARALASGGHEERTILEGFSDDQGQHIRQHNRRLCRSNSPQWIDLIDYLSLGSAWVENYFSVRPIVEISEAGYTPLDRSCRSLYPHNCLSGSLVEIPKCWHLWEASYLSTIFAQLSLVVDLPWLDSMNSLVSRCFQRRHVLAFDQFDSRVDCDRQYPAPCFYWLDDFGVIYLLSAFFLPCVWAFRFFAAESCLYGHFGHSYSTYLPSGFPNVSPQTLAESDSTLGQAHQIFDRSSIHHHFLHCLQFVDCFALPNLFPQCLQLHPNPSFLHFANFLRQCLSVYQPDPLLHLWSICYLGFHQMEKEHHEDWLAKFD